MATKNKAPRPYKKTTKKVTKKASKEKTVLVDTTILDFKKAAKQAKEEARDKLKEASAEWRDKPTIAGVVGCKPLVPPEEPTNPFLDPDSPKSAAWNLANRMRLRGLVGDVRSNQIEQMRRWDQKDVSKMDEYLRTAPAGLTAEELLKELSSKFDVVLDPPVGRFKHATFRRDELFIRAQEARELDDMIPTQPRSCKHNVSPKKPTETVSKTDALAARLEQLKSGGIKAESDKEWFDNFKVTNTALTNSVESMEAQYAEKIKLYLRAKREMEGAKQALEREYNKDVYSYSPLRVVLPNEGKPHPERVDEKPVLNMPDTLDQLFEGKNFDPKTS